MSAVNFTELRRSLDEAITYADVPLGRKLAEEGYRAAVEQENSGEMMMYFMAQREIIEDNFAEAIKYLDLAIQHNPSDGAAYNDRALCMLELGIIEESSYYFDKGIEVEPDYATVYHNKGWLLNKLGQHEQALIFFRKALELEPGRAVTYENMADAFVSLGKTREAISAYQKAILLLKSSHVEIRAQLEAQIEKLEKFC